MLRFLILSCISVSSLAVYTDEKMLMGTLGSQCRIDYDLFLERRLLYNASFWAWKSELLLVNFYQVFDLVSDAYGGVPLPGLMEGNHNSLGDFNSCVELQDDSSNIQGQYCSLAAYALDINKEMALNSPLIPGGKNGLNVSQCKLLMGFLSTLLQQAFTSKYAVLGACLPSSCSLEEVSDAFGLYGLVRGYILAPLQCTSKANRPELDGADIGYM